MEPVADRRSEKAIQAEIVRNLRDLGYAVTTFSQAQKAQMTPGIPDMVAAHYHWLRTGLWVEVKKPSRRNEPGGGCSTSQLQWHRLYRECGWHVMVAYCWPDVIAELVRLGAPITV